MRRLNEIGGWRITNQLGKGGNGLVFAVNRGATSGALKISNTKDPNRWRRFTDEIAAMKQCADIPGVLPILDTHTGIDARPWFVMGRATLLKTQLGRHPTLRSSVEAIRDIAHTLSRVHARGISHRDLKPENLFHFDGHWCVGDFGLVHFQGKASVTQTGERIGPVHYIAPEMLNAALQSDGRAADVFSLAKTLWVLATGQVYPLPGEYSETISAFRISSYVTVERTGALDALILAGTRFDPGSRPPMDQFAAELAAWLAPTAPSRARITLDVGQFAADLERQQTLFDAKRKRDSQIAADQQRHGLRIREALRPLAEDIAQSLRDARLDNVHVNIDKLSLWVRARRVHSACSQFWRAAQALRGDRLRPTECANRHALLRTTASPAGRARHAHMEQALRFPGGRQSRI